MMLKDFAKSIFNKITIAYPQNLETAQYLQKLEVNKISHLGNLKFAENFEENLDRININLKKELRKKKIWVASSTHKNEEVFCAKAHIELKKKVKNLIKGYESVKKVSIKEKKSLNILCRGAAMRYFLTRLFDYSNTPKSALIKIKDPREYYQKLVIHNNLKTYKDYIK